MLKYYALYIYNGIFRSHFMFSFKIQWFSPRLFSERLTKLLDFVNIAVASISPSYTADLRSQDKGVTRRRSQDKALISQWSLLAFSFSCVSLAAPYFLSRCSPKYVTLFVPNYFELEYLVDKKSLSFRWLKNSKLSSPPMIQNIIVPRP